jgi:hypothetical protein
MCAGSIRTYCTCESMSRTPLLLLLLLSGLLTGQRTRGCVTAPFFCAGHTDALQAQELLQPQLSSAAAAAAAAALRSFHWQKSSCVTIPFLRWSH